MADWLNERLKNVGGSAEAYASAVRTEPFLFL
jgi:hypothetical protein